ncbi:MAG: ribokinase [Firmicutes bacterium]|nr:ribokinase [Bacillota bacterium]
MFKKIDDVGERSMKKIVLLGSLNMDLVITSPYMPKEGETIKGDSFMSTPGGKGANQAVAAARAGGKVSMCGCLGEDVFGSELKNSLLSSGVDCSFLRTDSQQSTGIAIIIVVDGDNRIILDSGANARLTRADVDDALSEAGPGDIFLSQLEVPHDIVDYGLKKAKGKGLTTLLNPAPAHLQCVQSFEYVDILIPNESELEILGKSSDFDTAVKNVQAAGVKKLIVTLGSKGSVLIEGAERHYIDSYKVKAVDTTAAGDTFCGYLAAGISKGVAITDAMQIASAAAALSVTAAGAQKSIPCYNSVMEFVGKE